MSKPAAVADSPGDCGYPRISTCTHVHTYLQFSTSCRVPRAERPPDARSAPAASSRHPDQGSASRPLSQCLV